MDIKSEISQNGPNGRTNNNCVNYAVIKKSTLKQNGTNRNFNIELFRIIATSLVLIVHFNDFFVGGVTTNTELSDLCTQDFCQLFIQAISCCCINCFLVISGWFSIKLKFSALWNLWVILIGVYVPMWLLGIILGANLPIKDLINSIIAFSKESYFIQLYLMLIFLSPMLNTFVEKYNTYLLRYSIIFCSIEFLMEFCFHNKCLYIANGYSLIHFIIMYLLGRAAFIKQDKIKCISARWWFILYFVMVLTIFGSRIFGGGRMVHYAFSYSNPIVICESFFLFFVFGNYNYSVKRTPAIYSKNDWEFLTEKSKAKKLILFICQNKNNIYFARCSYKASGKACILYNTKLSQLLFAYGWTLFYGIDNLFHHFSIGDSPTISIFIEFTSLSHNNP